MNGKVFYIVRFVDDKSLQPKPISTIQELKEELLKEIEHRRIEEFYGWSPEDYTRENESMFHLSFDNERKEIEEAGSQEVASYLIKNINKLGFSWKRPTGLLEKDFENEANFLNWGHLESFLDLGCVS